MGKSEKLGNQDVKANLIQVSKHMFSNFKQHYTYFHILFLSHVFLKK